MILKKSYDNIYLFPNKNKVLLSSKVKNLMQCAIEFYEDNALAKFAKARKKSFVKNKALSHERIWKYLKKVV